MRKVYLDYSATTPMKKEVLDAMMPLMTETFGNASSVHGFGREARTHMIESRRTIAGLINAEANELFFTGGGTEADNWAIRGVAQANKKKGNHIITSSVEHHAVLHTCQALEKEGFEVTYIPVDEKGMVNPEDVKNAIKDTTILVTMMFINNEIGTELPIAEIGAITKEHGVFFHVDAVQAFGNKKIDVKALNIDLMSISAHKIYGPKGVGALYVRRGVRISNIIHGGAQEARRRPGTENVAGVVGFAKAAVIANDSLEEHIAHSQSLRDHMIERIGKEIPHCQLNGHPTKRHPGNVNFSFEFIEGEGLLLSLDLAGIGGSSGSACTSGSLDPSHVLMAIGLPHEIAHGSLRLTVGDFTTMEDIDYTVDELKKIVQRLRDMSPLYDSFIKGGK